MVQETPEEAQGVLKEAGYDFSIEEMSELRDIMLKISEAKNDGELSEEELEGVGGGEFILKVDGWNIKIDWPWRGFRRIRRW